MDANYSDCALAGAEQVSPDAVRAVEDLAEGTDLISILVRHSKMEAAIIQRIADAVATGDKDKVFALAVELVAHQNE